MAAEAGAVGRTPACLCVLCGLPAAGKSTLARKVFGAAAKLGWRVGVVSYDDLIPEHAFNIRAAGTDDVDLQDSHTEWKLHRREVLRCIEKFLEKPQVLAELPSSCPISRTAWEQCIQALLQPAALDRPPSQRTPLLFLLDDNFYYPSMRYEVYQLARRYSLGFCQVYLHCDLESCISRNQSRCEPIPSDVIMEMVKRLELPDPQKNSWEKNSISLNNTDTLSKCDIQRVMELISKALSEPLDPVKDNTEQTEADRLKCATNVLHQADQACRRLISEAMKTAKDSGVPPEHMKSLATQLNESKAAFLHDLRRQLLQEAPHLQDEDVDTEHVVERAISVFDRERKDILVRTMNINK